MYKYFLHKSSRGVKIKLYAEISFILTFGEAMNGYIEEKCRITLAPLALVAWAKKKQI